MLKYYTVYDENGYMVFDGLLEDLKEWVKNEQEDIGEVLERLDKFVGHIVRFTYTDKKGVISSKTVKVDNINGNKMLLQGWDLTANHKIDDNSYRNYKISKIKDLLYIA